jgi:hypothetical protein
VRPENDGSRVITETRVVGTSPEATRSLLRYWRVIRLGSSAIRRSWLATIRRLFQAQLDPARQKRCTVTQRDRRDRDDDLVQQPFVGELTRQVSPADDPNVPVSGGDEHLLVHDRDVRAGELDSRVRDDRQLAVREDPARDLVRPFPLRGILSRELVVEDPFVRRRPHRHRADLGDELAVVQRPVVLPLAGEQPFQRVVGVGDEAVEGRSRVVLGQAHDA